MRHIPRLSKLRDAQKGLTLGRRKNPGNWPFCIACHLAAPEHKFKGESHYDHGLPPPDLSKWGAVEYSNENGHREKHNLCERCIAMVALKIHQHHKATQSKLKQIAEAEARKAGLAPLLEQSIAKVKKERLVHADDCGVHEAGEDLPTTCTCGLYELAAT